jgi:hypothetical protein
MVHHKDAMWRIEYRTDQTRADSAMLPLAYMLESHWEDGVRWLGMLFRKRLTALELDRVNRATWPELENLEGFMKGLFDDAWIAAEDNVHDGEIRLGSDLVAVKFPVQSALNFAPTAERYAFGEDESVKAFPGLYAHLLGFRDALAPTLVSPVVHLPSRRAPVARPEKPDLEIANRAA